LRYRAANRGTDVKEERSLTISIELNEISDRKIQNTIESVIRACIGDLRKEEDWKIWIHAPAGYCQVVVKGPSQMRQRFFFDDVRVLPEKIRNWLKLYPFR
jgi:hypothetical protein